MAGLFHFCPMIKKTKLFFLLSMLLAVVTCSNDKASEKQSDKKQEASPLDSIGKQIKSNPNDPDLYKERAELWMEADSLQLALDDLERALRIDSTQDEVLSMQGDILYNLKMVKEARYVFNKCIEYNETNTNCLLNLAEIEFLLENHKKAIELTNNALRVDEYIPDAYALKGDIYQHTGDSARAASSYQTAIELDPEFYDGYIALGLLYGEAGNDLAIEFYNSAIELQPKRVEGLYNKAYYLQTTGFRDTSRYTKAIEIYSEIEEIDPSNATANFNKGFIHLEYLQNYEKAVDEFSEAIEKYPGYYQAFYNRGLSLESLGRLEAARNDYKKALSMSPQFTMAATALDRVNRNLGN